MEIYKDVTERLKGLVLSRYKSIRDFSISINMPYSTIDNIFKRGIDKASINNIISICQALGISTDRLAEGQIVPALLVSSNYNDTEKKLIFNFRSLNEAGREKAFVYTEDLIASGRYTEMVRVYRAAKSTDNARGGYTEIPLADLEALKAAKHVEEI